MNRFLGFLRPLAILAVAIVVALIMLRGRPEIEPLEVEVPLPVVRVQTISLSEVPVTVTAYGNVSAWRQLDLTSQISGRVLSQSTSFEPGEIVERGELLLRIDPTDYELALAEAQQTLTSAKLSLADASALKQTARIDESKAMVAAAEARIARAQRDLDNTEVRAPYKAVIDEQAVEPGQFVTVGMQLGRILGADKAEIRLPIPPQDANFIEAGPGVSVTLSAGESESLHQWTGRLARVEARLDAQTRVLPIVIEIEQPLDADLHGQPLRFGQFVRAEIKARSVNDAVLLPQAALHGDNDVFLLEDGKLLRRSVKLARISDGGAVIAGGLKSGDRVVTTRLELMFEGMAVAVGDE